MLKIQKFEVNMIQENCYILSDETNEAVVIDNGAFFDDDKDRIEYYIEKNRLKVVKQINTHGHFDHSFGTGHGYEIWEAKMWIHAADAELYTHCSDQIVDFMRQSIEIDIAPIEKELQEDDIITFGNQELKVIHTPGHTPGGVCFYSEENKCLFSGDSLFYGSIGRTDFPGSNTDALVTSLKEKILTLPTETTVYPGHGPSTTIAQEKASNPYLR